MFFFIWGIHLHISLTMCSTLNQYSQGTTYKLNFTTLISSCPIFFSVCWCILFGHASAASQTPNSENVRLSEISAYQNNINCTVQSHQTYIQIREIKIKLILVTAAIRDNGQEYSTKKSTSLCCIIENAKFYKEGFTKPRFLWLELDKYKISL